MKKYSVSVFRLEKIVGCPTVHHQDKLLTTGSTVTKMTVPFAYLSNRRTGLELII